MKFEVVTNNSKNIRELSYIFELIQKNRVQDYCEFIGKGEEVTVYGYKNFAIKLINNDKKSLLNDAEFLRRLSGNRNFPSLHAYGEKFIIVERIKGKTLGELGLRSLEQLRLFPANLKKSLIEAIHVCISKNIIPDDLHLNNIIYCEEEELLKIIDVGRFYSCQNQYIEELTTDYKTSCRTYNNLIA